MAQEECVSRIVKRVDELSLDRKLEIKEGKIRDRPFELERESLEESSRRSDVFTDYTTTPFSDFELLEFSNLSQVYIEGIMSDILRKEAPIHRDLIEKKIFSALKKFKIKLDEGQKVVIHNFVDTYDNCYINDSIYYLIRGQEIKVRNRRGLDIEREVQYLPKVELIKALTTVLKHSCGIEEEELLKISANKLGYTRGGRFNELHKVLEFELCKMLDSNLVYFEGEYLFLSKKDDN